MLGTMVLLASGFGFLIWNSYRTARARTARGERIAPEGTRRWPEAGADGS